MSLGITPGDIAMGARFFWRLPRFLRHRLHLAEAQAILRRRLERRESDFLALVRQAIYEHAESPYRQLLDLAGCAYGDLERLVIHDGVEGALRVLLRHGVYLTVDEFKGRRPVIRESVTIRVTPDRLQNPRSASHVPAGTGASRGAGTVVPMDFAHIRDRAVNTLLALDARGGAEWLKAHWHIPGGGILARLLEFSSFGAPVDRWFSQLDAAAPGLHPRYRWSARVLRWGSLLAGVPLPCPEYVPLDDPLPIAHWMTEALQAGRTPHLFTFVSSAVRLCRAALEAGIDLRGARFTVTGEPLTEARQAVLRRSGADAVARYAVTECGAVGFGCLAATVPDDVHLLHDLHAVIQPGPDGQHSGLPGGTLFISSLRPTAPFILLNVSMGDQAEVVRRACGCPLERLGWSAHLHTIRSHEKLTSGGMTFLDTDLIRILEEVLPTRFGGGPTDYQLLEEEGGDGQPRLRLLVHPAIGPVDRDAVREAFLAAISVGSGVERVMGLVWRAADFLRVERRAPWTTPAGKILHLHLERGSPVLLPLRQVPASPSPAPRSDRGQRLDDEALP